MKKMIWVLIAALALLAGGFWLARHQAGAAAGTAASPKPGAKVLVYQCSMHPQVVQDHPGICPICHMDLEQRELDVDDPLVKRLGLKAQAASPAAPSAGGVPGKAGFSLSPERRQLIGVASEEAKVQALSRTLRLPGRSGGVRTGRLVPASIPEVAARRAGGSPRDRAFPPPPRLVWPSPRALRQP